MLRLTNYIIYFFAGISLLQFVSIDALGSDMDDYDGMDGHLQSTVIVQTNEPLELLKACSFSNTRQKIAPDHHHNKRQKMLLHIGFDMNSRVVFFEKSSLPSLSILHTPILQPAYNYLFFTEINPPPPKYHC